MAYVSASEGLSGAVVVNLFTDTDADDVDASTTLKEIVLSYGGSADLGGGMKSTYGFTIKTESNDPQELWVDAYHVGLEAPFGNLWAGHVGGVTDANVPGGSLDSIAGSSDVGLTGNSPGQLRYESPRINGLKLGLSGVLDGSGGADGSLDQLNIMAHYELPIGLTMAAGYESKDRNPTPATDDHLNGVSDKASGFRFGATYSQDNWTVAYNYRKYNETNGFAGETFSIDNAAGNAVINVNRNNSTSEYQGHRMAAKFVVDRITMSANYSTETVSTDVAGGAKSKVDVDRTTLGVDARYTLGSKSWVGLGHQSKDTESFDGKIEDSSAPVSDKVGTTTLRYGVSF